MPEFITSGAPISNLNIIIQCPDSSEPGSQLELDAELRLVALSCLTNIVVAFSEAVIEIICLANRFSLTTFPFCRTTPFPQPPAKEKRQTMPSPSNYELRWQYGKSQIHYPLAVLLVGLQSLVHFFDPKARQTTLLGRG